MARKNKSNEDLPKAKINAQNFKQTIQIFSFAENHIWKFYVGLGFLLLTGGTALVFPKLLGDLVDCAKQGDLSKTNNITLILCAILVLQALFSFMRIFLFVNYTEHTLANMRVKLYSHLIKLPIHFFAQNRVGDLNSRISNDITQIQETLTTTIAEFLRQIILIIGGLIFLCFISLKLTLLMLCIVPFVAIAAVIFGRFIRKTSRKVQDAIAESNTIVDETLQSINNVKAFANEFFEIARYKKSINNMVQIALQSGKYRGYFASFIIFCLFGAIVAVVWYGVRLAINNEISIGSLISFVLYSSFVGASFGGIAELYAQLQKTVGSSERVFELFNEQAENIEEQLTPLKLEGNIKFENIKFHYPSRPELTVLKNLSIEIKAGQRIALVGGSGAGKSTIAQLLLQFYSSYSGDILIDGKSAKKYSLHDLRNTMAIVPQEVLLFGGSIKENIAYGKPNASDAEIIEAAKNANAYDFISTFPQGIDTLVGERGMKLSGGQKQRIAIARAILKNPSILILDEATSALDSDSERLVQQALDKLMQNRTSIIIAHRLATIREADLILVLNNGEIIEYGTHEQLMQIENGMYKHLSTLQFQERILN